MDQYVPLHFGARTWIVPWNHDLPQGADAADAAGAAAASAAPVAAPSTGFSPESAARDVVAALHPP